MEKLKGGVKTCLSFLPDIFNLLIGYLKTST